MGEGEDKDERMRLSLRITIWRMMRKTMRMRYG